MPNLKNLQTLAHSPRDLETNKPIKFRRHSILQKNESTYEDSWTPDEIPTSKFSPHFVVENKASKKFYKL